LNIAWNSRLKLTESVAHKIAYFQQDLSDFGKHKWDPEDLDKFLLLMSGWGNAQTGVMKDHQKSTLGYYLTTQKPETVNPLGPTFPPTALKHQHYKYIAPGSTEPEDGLEKGKNNMLLYLEMTQQRPFPSEDILEYSGNFVAAGMKGTACISREIFWDSYLLCSPPLDSPSGIPPLLREFNRHLYAWQAGFHVWASGFEAGVQWSYGIGPQRKEEPHPPSYFSWARISPTEWEFNTHSQKHSSDTGAMGYWAEGDASGK
jgi:hypothetical protein